MRITEIREMSVPLAGTISNAVVDFSAHRVSLVAVVTDHIRDGRPLTGVAFNSIGRHSQAGILRERMIPRILAADPGTLLDPATGALDPARVLACAMTDEKPGGHGDRAAASSAVELAVWDLLAKLGDEPAWRTISRHHGRPGATAGVPVYAAGGYYRAGTGIPELVREVEGYFDAHYEAVKIKVGGLDLAQDVERVAAVVEAAGSGARVAVDANGRFGTQQAIDYGRVLEQFGLRWYEEPIDPLDLRGHRDLAEAYDGALATGENLFSVPDVKNLLDFGGLRPDRDLLQMDAGLSYGLTEYTQMIDLMETAGFPRSAAVPHGGHLINLHIVTGLELGGCEAYPGVFEPFGGYSEQCLLSDGLIHPSDAPGFGLEQKKGLDSWIKEVTR